jgi:hypothetical protein
MISRGLVVEETALHNRHPQPNSVAQPEGLYDSGILAQQPRYRLAYLLVPEGVC